MTERPGRHNGAGARNSAVRRRINALAFAKIIRAMVDEPQSIQELVEITGLCTLTVSRYVRAIHQERGCYIDDWAPNARGIDVIPKYMIGRKEDTVRPKKSEAERGRAYRAKLKQQQILAALQGRAS